MGDTLSFTVERSTVPVQPEQRAAILADPGFGQYFTDHLALAYWTPERSWHESQIAPYAPLPMDPATATLHYAQEVFEGLKAYRHPDGSIWAFRPEVNAARFQRSSRRLALQELPTVDFLAAITALVDTDREWVPPSGGEKSLYLRPFMFASEIFLGVRAARHVTFCLIASPAGAYFGGGVRPVTIWLSEEFMRAAPGGTGAAKCGGNYAASLVAQQEAVAMGCDQVAFVDAVEQRWIEELGGMNLFFVHDDGTLVTPQLTDTILEGVTRHSILTLAKAHGHAVEERRVEVAEWRDGVRSGRVTEVFACGTAAVVTPVSTLRWRGGEVSTGDQPGPVTAAIRQALVDVQYGRAQDAYGWMHRLA